MEKARPKRKMNLEELYKNDLMYFVIGKQYVAIKQKNDNDHKKPSINNGKEQGPTEPRPVRVLRSINTLPGYSG